MSLFYIDNSGEKDTYFLARQISFTVLKYAH